MAIKTLVYWTGDAKLPQRIEHAIRAGLGPRPPDEDWRVMVFPTQTGIGWDVAIRGRGGVCVPRAHDRRGGRWRHKREIPSMAEHPDERDVFLAKCVDCGTTASARHVTLIITLGWEVLASGNRQAGQDVLVFCPVCRHRRDREKRLTT